MFYIEQHTLFPYSTKLHAVIELIDFDVTKLDLETFSAMRVFGAPKTGAKTNLYFFSVEFETCLLH